MNLKYFVIIIIIIIFSVNTSCFTNSDNDIKKPISHYDLIYKFYNMSYLYYEYIYRTPYWYNLDESKKIILNEYKKILTDSFFRKYTKWITKDTQQFTRFSQQFNKTYYFLKNCRVKNINDNDPKDKKIYYTLNIETKYVYYSLQEIEHDFKTLDNFIDYYNIGNYSSTELIDKNNELKRKREMNKIIGKGYTFEVRSKEIHTFYIIDNKINNITYEKTGSELFFNYLENM